MPAPAEPDNTNINVTVAPDKNPGGVLVVIVFYAAAFLALRPDLRRAVIERADSRLQAFRYRLAIRRTLNEIANLPTARGHK